MTDRLRPGVLFDVDGTLADTNYLHTLAWSRALHDADEWAPMNAIHRLIGMGGDQLVPTLLGHESKAATKARPSRYKELMGDARVFPGAHDLLWRLHREGLAVVLATSAPDQELGPLLELLDADEAIDATTSADNVAASKPDPEVFLRAMATGAVDPERAFSLGDSIWDIQAARAAGIGCIAVETGGSANTSWQRPEPHASTGMYKRFSTNSGPAPSGTCSPDRVAPAFCRSGIQPLRRGGSSHLRRSEPHHRRR